MSEETERIVGDLKIVIDRGLCVGFAQCIDLAAQAFDLDDEDTVVFDAPERVSREQLLAACRACPVEALVVLDSAGNRLVP